MDPIKILFLDKLMTMRKLKQLINRTIHALSFYFLNRIISYIPIYMFRSFFYNFLFKKIGKKNSFLMGLELRYPKNIIIGNNNVINRNVMLDGRGGSLIIGDNVDIAQETNIWTLEHDVHDDFHKDSGGDVIIEDYVWIASRVTILPGVTLGRGSVIAAGAIVTKDVMPMDIVAGIPAKKIGVRKSNLLYSNFHQPLFQ